MIYKENIKEIIAFITNSNVDNYAGKYYSGCLKRFTVYMAEAYLDNRAQAIFKESAMSN